MKSGQPAGGMRATSSWHPDRRAVSHGSLARAADLTIAWEEGFYPEEDKAHGQVDEEAVWEKAVHCIAADGLTPVIGAIAVAAVNLGLWLLAHALVARGYRLKA